MNLIVPPVKKGARQDLAQLIVGLIDYEEAGKFRRDLAQKVLHAQIALARAGW
jgi:hypothetical protein